MLRDTHYWECSVTRNGPTSAGAPGHRKIACIAGCCISQLSSLFKPMQVSAGAADLEELKAHPFFGGIDWACLRSQPAPEFIAEPSLDPGKRVCALHGCIGTAQLWRLLAASWCHGCCSALSLLFSLSFTHSCCLPPPNCSCRPRPYLPPLPYRSAALPSTAAARSPEQRQQQLRLGAAEPGLGAAARFICRRHAGARVNAVQSRDHAPAAEGHACQEATSAQQMPPQCSAASAALPPAQTAPCGLLAPCTTS